jgi:hypothetical protein
LRAALARLGDGIGIPLALRQIEPEIRAQPEYLRAA